MAHKSHILFLNVSFLVILVFFISIHLPPSLSSTPLHLRTTTPHGCKSIETLKDYKAKCSYLKTHKHSCSSQGFIDYLDIFYCICGKYPSLGYTVLALWLLVLFYLLGNTASQYFCSSLEGLSRALRLPPTVAGVTLLALGNGAPDVFSSIVSARDGDGEVGLNSILGGAFFVSTVVVGVISICVAPRSVGIDRASFIRDVGFFIAVLGSLLLMLIDGKITVLGSVGFTSLYIVYVAAVSVGQFCGETKIEDLEAPLLGSDEIEHLACTDKRNNECESNSKPLTNCLGWILYLVEMPLYLPRRLTIPDIAEERWCKPIAVASVVLSPILLATLWHSGNNWLAIYLIALLLGIILGIIAAATTEQSRPPVKFILPWQAGGFLMSVVWTYITAGELVALLLAAGHILSISPAILGLTVLAWGNSIGDLIANVAMAIAGGEDGVQIAISGCYAGPVFNTLVGLGLSLVISAWRSYPVALRIKNDQSLYETVGFLIGGLLWALVVVPRRGMKLDRVFGIGLLGIYLCFLCLRLSEYTGLL